VGIPQGFPKSFGRVGSRLYGFPYFPYSVISAACFVAKDYRLASDSSGQMSTDVCQASSVRSTPQRCHFFEMAFT